jgi:aminopeptidase N
MPSLTRDEAVARAALLTVERMQVDLDLTLGDQEFGSRTEITFTSASPGASTFVDLRPVRVASIRLNGAEVPPDTLTDGRLELAGLAERNTLVVEATMAYARDGQGLHRAVDPADGEAYVYGHLFLDRAPSVFACFDQPDLKAPYAVTVRAPQGWVVVGNGAEQLSEQDSAGVWTLAETKPLATYFVTVCAGPYAVVRDEHDGIPLGLYARASLEPQLRAQAESIVTTTRQSFDHFHGLFGIRYPFGKYDQVFVPEFNAGAMENPGCVTFRDTYLFRGAATHEQQLERANTIAHEMAHMWFGDLVTMRWWDDLWLNESFAEYMSYRCLTTVTEYDDAWVEFCVSRKLWGYAAERSPSTHPVAGSPAPDALSALQNFDGISYAKGAAVLRQLIAAIGDEAFLAGVTAYLRGHEYGNGDLGEFLAAVGEAAGRDLGEWADAWLRTAGADTLATWVGGTVMRGTPQEHPANRPHTFDVAGWTDGVERFRVPVTIDRPQIRHEALAAADSALVVVPNASDLTWANTELEPHTLEALPTQLAKIPDGLARAVTWVALLSGTCAGSIDPRRVLDVFTAAWTAETNDVVLGRVARQLIERLIPCFLPPEAAESARSRVAGAAMMGLRAAEEGSGRAIAFARVIAATSSDEDRLRFWLDGQGLPQGLSGDADFRWIVVRNLAAQGLLDEMAIERLREADDTLTGRQLALAARAAIPTESAKGWAWTELTTNRALSNYDLLALASGFWLAPDAGLVRPYVDRYPDAITRMAEWIGDDALARVTSVAFPSRLVEDGTAAMVRATLERDDLTPGVRRALVDGQSELGEALRSRSSFG